MIEHNVKTWFGDNFLDYFENQWQANRIGTFKVPQTTAKYFDLTDQAIVKKLADAIANSWIAVAVQLKATEFSEIEFVLFEDDTKEQLRMYVCEAVQHAIMNRNIWERTNGSSLSGGNYNFMIDAPGWILTQEMCGKFAWTNLQNSGIDEYEWLEDEYTLMKRLANGNIMIVKEIK